MPRDEVALAIGERAYSGWTRVIVRRSMETIAGGFELVLTERWPGQQARGAIHSGDRCRVTIGGETVITGYVDTVEPVYDADRHEVTVRGRDAAGDLADCSILAGATNLPTGPALGMITQICKPFGILVSSDLPAARALQVVLNMAVQLSETAFEAISRIAEQSGFIVVSDGKGGIRLTTAGSGGNRGAVILGMNILSARGRDAMNDRFSDYLVASQTVAGDNVDPRAAATGNGTAKDPGVPRYRPLVLMVDVGSTGYAYLTQRAQWEATVRLGRALRATVTVQGWRDNSGALWEPNTICRVDDDFLAIDGPLLISGVALSLDEENGTRAELTLTRREAFTAAPLPLSPSVQGAAP